MRRPNCRLHSYLPGKQGTETFSLLCASRTNRTTRVRGAHPAILMNDTNPKIAEMIRQRYLALSPAERLVIGARMFESARAMVVASLSPGLSPEKTRRRICERLYADLAEEVFGRSEDRAVRVLEQQSKMPSQDRPHHFG